MPRKQLTLFTMGAALYLLGWAALLTTLGPPQSYALRATLLALCSMVVLRAAVLGIARRPFARPQSGVPPLLRRPVMRPYIEAAERQPRQEALRPPYDRREGKERRRARVRVLQDRRQERDRRQEHVWGKWT